MRLPVVCRAKVLLRFVEVRFAERMYNGGVGHKAASQTSFDLEVSPPGILVGGESRFDGNREGGSAFNAEGNRFD